MGLIGKRGSHAIPSTHSSLSVSTSRSMVIRPNGYHCKMQALFGTKTGLEITLKKWRLGRGYDAKLSLERVAWSSLRRGLLKLMFLWDWRKRRRKQFSTNYFVKRFFNNNSAMICNQTHTEKAALPRALSGVQIATWFRGVQAHSQPARLTTSMCCKSSR